MKVVLDSGYLTPVEHWGSDARIVEAARMSTGKGFLGWGDDPICLYCGATPMEYGTTPCFKAPSPADWHHNVTKQQYTGKPGDEKLLRTLYTKGHTTPFEMAGATFEVFAPIFVFREWMRHRTLSYNEFSARYSELPNSFYVPDYERLRKGGQSKSNKQASGEELGDLITQGNQAIIEHAYDTARKTYEELLSRGLSKELARLVIPVGQYSKMRVSGNLLNWIRFLRLRVHHTAQFEIREYAIQVEDTLFRLFPRTMALYAEERDARTEREALEVEKRSNQ